MTETKLSGHLILIVSVPGGGKSILMDHLKEARPQLTYATSCTSRPMRPGERDGDNYYFLTEAEFEARIEQGDFLEWVKIDGGRYYGTLKSEIIDRLKRGEIVLREVEIMGAKAIKDMLPPENLSIIFITAGPWEDMAVRIKARAPISEEELEYRRLRYEKETPFAAEADYVLENKNGELEDAKLRMVALVDRIIDAKR